MEMGMDGLLPLRSAGDVRYLKERHGGRRRRLALRVCGSGATLDLANLVLKERWPLSAHRRDNRVRNGQQRRFADSDGRIHATFDVIWLSGWAPHESQPKPLRLGSAKASLEAAVKRVPK
jgi:hypothetical protein